MGGTFSNPILTNTALNAKIDIRAVNVTDLVIDCRPGRRSVVINGQPNYAAMTSDSELWALAVGSQAITISATSNLVAIRPTFTWARRFLSI